MDRDVLLILWVGRFGLCTAGQVAGRFGLPASTAYRRLGVLRDAGVLGYSRPLRGDGVFFATRAGLRLCDLELPVERVGLGALKHSLAMTDAVSELEGLGCVVFSEREIRASRRLDVDTPEGGFVVSYRIGGEQRARSHTPDIAVLSPDKETWVAVEVELTAKSAKRTKGIIKGYDQHPDTLRGVLYLVPTAGEVGRINRLVEKEWGRKPVLAAEKSNPPQIAEQIRQILKTTQPKH